MICLPEVTCQCLKTFLVVTTERCYWHLVSGDPGMLLNILQCTGQWLQQRIIQPQLSIVPRLKNSDLGENVLEPCYSKCGLQTSSSTKEEVSDLTPPLQSQNLWRRGPGVCVSTSSPRELHACFLLLEFCIEKHLCRPRVPALCVAVRRCRLSQVGYSSKISHQ